MKKTITTLLGLFLVSFYFWSFEWPQPITNTTPFYSWFAESRGSSFCSALIFTEPADIKASDDGHVLAILGTFANEDGWINGTLGNTVILSHSNKIDTVYGNLEQVSITDSITDVKAGDLLGTSGNSGWQDGKSCLEFQVLDTKLEAIINPLLLLQKKEIEKEFSISNLKATNQTTGETYTLKTAKSIPAGIYSLYCDSKKSLMPFSVTASINGVAAETIKYDTLTLQSNRLSVNGKRPHSFNEVYPEENRFMLAEIILSHGKSTLTLTTGDSEKNEKYFSYRFEIQ